MEIEVKDMKLLFLYRNFLFRSVKFKTNSKELSKIVKALNIKDRKKRIEYIYDEAVKYINNYYSDDLCQFKNNQCIAQRKGGSSNINGCCRKCALVSDKGCSSCNLACKLVYCKTALKNVRKLRFSEIPILKCLSIFQRLILRGSFFSKKEDIINDLHYGILYSMFRLGKKYFS